MPPIDLLIKPASSLCNMNCKYCFYSDVSSNREFASYGIMSRQTAENLIKSAFEYASGHVGFAFQGGEPTLAGLDFYRFFVDTVQKYKKSAINVSYSIQTNGYAINEEWAEFFAQNNFLVGLSVDGFRQVHDELRLDRNGKGTYDKVMRSAEIMKSKGVDVNVLCVVNNFVARYPKKVYEALKGFGYVQFIPCIDDFSGNKQPYSLSIERYTDFLNDTFDLYYRDIMANNYVSVRNFDNYVKIILGGRPESCAMNGFCTCYCVVEADGGVYPCDFYVLDEWRLGNINNDKLFDMINSAVAKKFVDVSRIVNDECKKCNYYKLCRGGCRRDREPFVGEVPSLNKYCKAYKAFFDKNTDRLIKIARMLSIQR